MTAIRPGHDDAVALVQHMLEAETAGWSIGTFGAIAEFHHVIDDPPGHLRLTEQGGDCVTARGGIRVRLSEAVVPIAYEGLSERRAAWSVGVVFCVSPNHAMGGGRTVLTELGRDAGAIRDQDRGAVLFDLGLGAQHVAFCVRTAEPELVHCLRGASGKPLLIPGNQALAAIRAASPHRVCRSPLGRVEVYQAIPADDADAASPHGPHTHLLPRFLNTGRSHSANVPVPDGMMPALFLHPESPLSDRLGRPRVFDEHAFAAFQALLAMFGPPGFLAEKARVRAAVLAGGEPRAYPPASTRTLRRATRVALRQLLYTEGDQPDVRRWIGALDRGRGACLADASNG